jgi:hypothetical protein
MTKILTLLLLLLLLSLNNVAQVTHASISQHEVKIGERVTLSYSLPIKVRETVEFKPYNRFIPALKADVSEKNKDAAIETVEVLLPFRDTIIVSEGGPVWTGYYEITVWDSGAFTLPGPTIKIGKEKLQFPAVSFSGQFAPAIRNLETYDIKESFAELPPKTLQDKLSSFLSDYWVGIVLVATALIGLILYKRRMRSHSDEGKEFSVYERILRELKELEDKELWKSGNVKTHYTHLSLLLKNYLADVYALYLREQTTSETLLLLKQKIHSKDLTVMVKKILETSDLVKFAKYNPQENEVKTHLKDCTQLISLIHERTSVSNEQ